MEGIVTYSLLNQSPDPDRYFRDISAFTDEVLQSGEKWLGSLISDYRKRLGRLKRETIDCEHEYILELLCLGVLWHGYMDRALTLSARKKEILQGLIRIRKRGGAAKAGADLARGILATLFLFPSFPPSTSKAKAETDIFKMQKLIRWLEATHEFDESVQILQKWQSYLSGLEPQERNEYLSATLDFACWFKKRSIETIGQYTGKVDSYLQQVFQARRGREDLLFCSRKRVEYHLNMVGAEIMNRQFRADFLKTKEIRLLLPVCMRLKDTGECKARSTPNGDVCLECSPECNVCRLNKLGKIHGFTVLIIAHGSSAFTEEEIKEGEVGIIGVACILNLLEGGWRACNLKFVPQCVPLDYCGCRRHWHPRGIITSINLNQLNKVLSSGHSPPQPLPGECTSKEQGGN